MNETLLGTAAGAVVIGGGPAGLMAAETISQEGIPVTVYDSMRSVGRKFLLAGRGGLNLTHSEPLDHFLTRYRDRQAELTPFIESFPSSAVRQWAADLGVATFVGSSGRVFPTDMKAAPLLRAWLGRLRADGVTFHMRHRWLGWDSAGNLQFDSPAGIVSVQQQSTVLALGGGSWPQLGSTGSWTNVLATRGVTIAPLQPANCGFSVDWSDHFRTRFSGQPVKSVTAQLYSTDQSTTITALPSFSQQGEFIITDYGVEGSLIYAASAQLRATVTAKGTATIFLDLAPSRTEEDLRDRLTRPRGAMSKANHWRRQASISGVKAGLLYEFGGTTDLTDPVQLSALIKRLPMRLGPPRPLAEAISSAGGVHFSAVDGHLQFHALPGVFCAGEMLDWEAPTGGYLLTACLATGRAAGLGLINVTKMTGKTPEVYNSKKF